MIFAEKIVELRKKEGWSQEELADRLDVSRQSVSKWESSQSMPEMDKIIQLSRLFGVSTDYLLLDGIEYTCGEKTSLAAENNGSMRRISVTDARKYISARKKSAPIMAFATFLCIISPITLIILGAMSEDMRFRITENMAVGIGLCTLVLLVSVAVALFLCSSSQGRKYDFLGKEQFLSDSGVADIVSAEEKSFRLKYDVMNITATVMCIISVLPLFISASLGASDFVCVLSVCILVFTVGVAGILFVCAGTVKGTFDRLMQTGDFSRKNKKNSSIMNTVGVCYWLIVTAVYLTISFVPSFNIGFKNSWIVWAVAGVLYGAVVCIVRAVAENKGNK